MFFITNEVLVRFSENHEDYINKIDDDMLELDDYPPVEKKGSVMNFIHTSDLHLPERYKRTINNYDENLKEVFKKAKKK